MVFVIASSLVSLACQGCVSSGAADYAYAEPAAEQSLGMTLAMPGTFGDGALNAPTGSALVGEALPAVSPTAPGLLLSGPDADLAVFATAPAPSPFSLTGSGLSGVPQSDSSFGWSASPALASVAAEVAMSRYGQPDPEYNDMSFGLSIAATSGQTGLGFDVGVAPRLAVNFVSVRVSVCPIRARRLRAGMCSSALTAKRWSGTRTWNASASTASPTCR